MDEEDLPGGRRSAKERRRERDASRRGGRSALVPPHPSLDPASVQIFISY